MTRKAEKLKKGKELESKGNSTQDRKSKRVKYLNFVEEVLKPDLRKKRNNSNVKDHTEHLFLKVQYSVCPVSS